MARILIVEDDSEQLVLRIQMLERAGHEILAAATVTEGIRLMGNFQPAILLMDLRVPSLSDGLALIRSATEQPSPPRIVVLSGWPEQLEDRPEAALVARILSKPTPMATLLDIMRQLAIVLLCVCLGSAASLAQEFPLWVLTA